MKLFIQSSSWSKQIGPLQIKSKEIKTNIPLPLQFMGLNLKNITVKQFKSNIGDMTLILRKL
jgi:hypothetical protein